MYIFLNNVFKILREHIYLLFIIDYVMFRVYHVVTITLIDFIAGKQGTS